MNPFIHLPNYHVIVYVGPRCKYAVLPIHVDSHLSNARHNYNKEQREQVNKRENGLAQKTAWPQHDKNTTTPSPMPLQLQREIA